MARTKGQSIVKIAGMALSVVGATLFSSATFADTGIGVVMNEAKIVKLARPADTIIIGNPAIADATIQDRQTLVITGKITGVTNLVILDAKGELIADELINVEKADRGMVTVQRGARRYTYACTPNCNVALEPGDATEYFSQASSQMAGRSGFVAQSTGPTQ